ncbi:MAG: glycoside hydrolase family 3 C-terminal domain-containing protein, partial [Hyphomonadaceae bacterium]|nr:glycoside hydrolase family 3 C-terminal domain-containing protein [Hyphomonadaceae bacterium]
MSAYNRVNGTYASEHRQLLTGILRDEWGYEGVVVSDWGAAKSTIASVQAGLDLEMPGPGRHYGKALMDAVEAGAVSEGEIDTHVARILRLILRAGLMDDNPKASRGALNTPEHHELARRTASEAMVLLKNRNGALPLKPSQRIAVIGAPAHRPTIQGGGSSQVSPFRMISPLDAMREAWTGWDIRYAQGVDHEVSPPIIDSRLLRDETGGEGLTARYFSEGDFSGEPILVERDWRFFKLGFGRAAQSPESLDFAVEWRGTFTPDRSGVHAFSLAHTCPHVELVLDDDIVIATETPAEREKLFMFLELDVRKARRDLEAGRTYRIRLRYSQPADGAILGFNVFAVSLRPPAPSFEEAISLAADSDVAMVFAGAGSTAETEGQDRASMALDADQSRLIESVAEVSPKTVVVLNTGAPVEMDWADSVDAILQTWLPGQEGGYAIADLLSGAISPSGKLPVTFPKAYRDNPTWLYYPGGTQADYGEGLFVGYRYYDAAQIEPLFPFGHGLTYSSFTLEGLQLPDMIHCGAPLPISLRLTNTGRCHAQETVQIYIEDLATQETRPLRQLRAFRKVALDPNAEASVQFELDPRALCWFDTDKNDWAATPGRYLVHAGFSSRDIRATAPFDLAGTP